MNIKIMLGLFKEYRGCLILENELMQFTMLTEEKKASHNLLSGCRKKYLISFKIHSW